MASTINGILDSSYVSVNSLYNQRSIRKKLFPTYNEESLFNFLVHSGARKVTENEVFNWFEEDLLTKRFQIESYTGSGADTPIVVTLEEADHQVSGTLSEPLEGDSVILYGASTKAKGTITSVNKGVDDAHTVTIINDVPGVDLDSIVAVGDYIGIIGNAQPDGSSEPDSRVRQPIQRSGVTQIFRNNFEANGSVAANKIEFDDPGTGQPFWILKGESDMALRHEFDMEYSFVLGEYALASAANGQRNKTRGIESYLDNFGNTETYSTLAWADVQNMVKTLDRQGADPVTMFLTGTDVDLDLEALLKTQAGEGGGLDFSAFGDGNGIEKAVDLGIRKFTVGGRVFMLKKFKPLNYQGSTANDGTITSSPYPEMAFGLPIGKVKDAKTNDMIDTICLRYKAGPKQSRWLHHYVRDINVTGDDKLRFGYLTEAGLEFAVAQHGIKLAK